MWMRPFSVFGQDLSAFPWPKGAAPENGPRKWLMRKRAAELRRGRQPGKVHARVLRPSLIVTHFLGRFDDKGPWVMLARMQGNL